MLFCVLGFGSGTSSLFGAKTTATTFGFGSTTQSQAGTGLFGTSTGTTGMFGSTTNAFGNATTPQSTGTVIYLGFFFKLSHKLI